MKQDTYSNLTELNHQLQEEWYTEDWEKDKHRVDVQLNPMRYLALIIIIFGVCIGILAG